jgi:hypothetical protein
MKRIVRGAAVVAAMVVLSLSTAALAGEEGAAAQKPDDGWRTVIYPVYGWLPLYRAKTHLPERTGGAGGGIIAEGTTDTSLDQAILAGLRVEKGRFSLEGGVLYAGLSAERDRPLVKTTVDTSLGDLRLGYAMVPDFYVEAGARYLALKMKATIDDFAQATWKPDILQPVVGLTYRPRLGKTWRLVLHGDVGGVVTDTGTTAVGTARVEWQPLKHLLLTAGGSVMYLKSEGKIASRDVELDQTLYGPVLGVGIPF